MNDFKLPEFREELPPAKKISREAFLEMVIRRVSEMTAEERRRQMDRRSLPCGERFTL